jgi:hypothetical protein
MTKNFWLALVISLPTENATARMRIWRAVKTLGCAGLRDGVWLLPARPDLNERFGAIAEDTRLSGGEAWVLTLQADGQQADTFPILFDRSADYSTWLEELTQFDPLAEDLPATRKQLKNLSKRLTILIENDYFPNPLQATAQARLQAAETALRKRSVPAEPTSQAGEPERLNPADFQGKTWATRRDLWVDRLASAWLIQRFIDPQAHFLWLAHTADCPTEALGFDFDGAQFTHIGRYVTFETLLHSFALAQDPALQRLAHLVHTLDVGGSAPEAAGFALLLKGLKHRTPDDTTLLAAGGQLLNDLYYAFSTQEDTL